MSITITLREKIFTSAGLKQPGDNATLPDAEAIGYVGDGRAIDSSGAAARIAGVTAPAPYELAAHVLAHDAMGLEVHRRGDYPRPRRRRGQDAGARLAHLGKNRG